MAFKDVRNLVLINHNDGFIDDDEFVVLYDLYTSRNLDCPYDSYALFMLLKRLSYPCRNGDMIHSLCREIRSAYRSLTALAVTRNSGLFREFK